MICRELTPEKMDDPRLPEPAHRLALAGLRRINLVSGTARAMLQPILRFAAKRRQTSIKLLDVACGGGDVPIAIATAAARLALHIELTLFDRSSIALHHAKQSANAAGIIADTIEGNATIDLDGKSYDVVTNSLFLHHLNENDAVAVLKNMSRAASGLLVVSDLRRSAAGYAAAKLACQVLSRSKIVHYDGPVSVRAAWSEAEFLNLAKLAGISNPQITRQWPWRILLQSEQS